MYNFLPILSLAGLIAIQAVKSVHFLDGKTTDRFSRISESPGPKSDHLKYGIASRDLEFGHPFKSINPLANANNPLANANSPLANAKWGCLRGASVLIL